MTEAELKPCPFCGRTPKIVTRDVEPQGDSWYGRKDETFVLCDCGACLFDGDFHEGFWDAQTRAVAAWNHRTPMESLPQQEREGGSDGVGVVEDIEAGRQAHREGKPREAMITNAQRIGWDEAAYDATHPAESVQSHREAGESATRNSAIEEVAAMLDKKADDYAHTCGRVDWETGALEFGTGPSAQVREDHYNDLRELADEVRGMKGSAPVPADGGRAVPAAQVPSNNYVQPVPDHCDRIVWRNRYYHLPFAAAPSVSLPVADCGPISETTKEQQHEGSTAQAPSVGVLAAGIDEGTSRDGSPCEASQPAQGTPLYQDVICGVEAGERLTRAAKDVLAERARQINVEGWTPEHDDEHGNGELAFAAACYAQQASGRAWMFGSLGDAAERYARDDPPDNWPDSWDTSWWRPKNPRRDLVRAAALILAEIERMDRAAPKDSGAPHEEEGVVTGGEGHAADAQEPEPILRSDYDKGCGVAPDGAYICNCGSCT